MKLKDVDFKTFVFGQSGVQGFFGEGDEYPHHKFLKLIPGFSFLHMVFVAKTFTLYERIFPQNSNTELISGYKIKRFLPNSIWVTVKSWWGGYLLNAVGLANPGIRQMLNYNKWQNRTDAFQLSFMPMETDPQRRVLETQEVAAFLHREMPFHPKFFPYALQVNLSCPNTGHENQQNTADAIAILSALRDKLPGVPLIPKFDLLIEPKTIVALKPYCDAFMIGNTLAFGKKPEKINWKKLFSGGISPLLKYFNGKFAGGLSGAPLFPLLVEWLEKMQAYDSSVVIIAGGGIMKKKNILRLSQFHIVHGVALGSVAILRPWRLQGLIQYGNKIFNERNKNS